MPFFAHKINADTLNAKQIQSMESGIVAVAQLIDGKYY